MRLGAHLKRYGAGSPRTMTPYARHLNPEMYPHREGPYTRKWVDKRRGLEGNGHKNKWGSVAAQLVGIGADTSPADFWLRHCDARGMGLPMHR